MFDEKKLIELAFDAQKFSYSPYSNFKVGACVATRDGNFIQGANIENAAYGCTMCGERNAVFHAYCVGYKKDDILAVCITSNCNPVASPCGSCRQVLSELCNPDTKIICVSSLGDRLDLEVKDLLPYVFNKEQL